MISLPNLQQYTPNYQNIYANGIQQNYFNNSNIFNNFGSGYTAAFDQSFTSFNSSPMFMQPQQQPQQDNSMNMLMQLIQMILPLILGDNAPTTNTKAGKQPVTIDQTEIKEESAGAWGDPHYQTIGADGKTAINFDHKGQVGQTYNVFQGDGYQVDARYDNWPTGYAVMGETNIKAGADSIGFKASGELTINGQAVKEGETVSLNDGTKVSLKGKDAIIESRDGDGAKIKLTSVNDPAGNYINVDPSGKMSNLGGILGSAIAQNKNLTEEECEKFKIAK